MDPEIDIRLYDDRTKQQNSYIYKNYRYSLPEGVAEASVIYGDLIHTLGDLLIETELDAESEHEVDADEVA